jgi:hypothetical protein
MVNDPVLLAKTLPQLGETAMRDAVRHVLLHRNRPPTVSALANEALVRFEALVQAAAAEGVRPAALFAERDRIVSELRRFASSRLASRCFGIARRNVLAAGAQARPFDAIVRGRDGAPYGLSLRRLPSGPERLAALPTVTPERTTGRGERISGVVTYDFRTGTTHVVRRDGVRRRSAAA